MNLSTIIGIISGVAVLSFATLLGGGTFVIFFNIPGLLIVIGGVAAASIISLPIRDIPDLFRAFLSIFRKESVRLEAYIPEILTLASMARKGVLELEKEIKNIKHPFLRDAIQMIVDNYTDKEIREILESRIINYQLRKQSQPDVFRTMSLLAPAFGMIGTLFGLCMALSNMKLKGSMEKLGPSMAIALTTTLYGALLANFLFKPVAEKIERKTEEKVLLFTMIMESVIMIYKKRHPFKIEDFLNGFIRPGMKKEPSLREQFEKKGSEAGELKKEKILKEQNHEWTRMKSDDRRQTTEDRRQRTEDRRQI